MNLRKAQHLCLLLLSLSPTLLLFQAALGQTPLQPAFRYSRTGMKLDGVLLNGTFDFKFKLFDARTAGTHVGETVSINGLSVSNGSLPTQTLDFGVGAFNGDARFLQVIARQGAAQFKSVGSRTEVLAVPYALALPGFRTEPNVESPNIIGGFAGNFVVDGVFGATIAGGGTSGQQNSVAGELGAVGGGQRNEAAGFASTVSGGSANTASGPTSFIGGGFDNTAGATFATVGGGRSNNAQLQSTTIAGGDSNTASGVQSTVGGGAINIASGASSTVAGGVLNVASGNSAMVVGGVSNLAAGNTSFAAGRRAKANANGTFVWADSTDADFAVGGANRFSVRASGGAEIFTNAGITTGVFLSPGSGSWSTVSDRNLKENLVPVNVRDALDRVLSLPISTWNYTAQDESIRHVGPMAQDFHAAFGLGESDRHITTVDADGVALAAIQGLHQLLIDKDGVISAQQKQIDDLSARLARLEATLTEPAAR